MGAKLWADVDHYLAERLLGDDAAPDAVLRSSAAAGLPPIHVSPLQGKLLFLLAKLCGARRVLELGTLGGYSTAWLAQALPAEGRVISLEADEKHAEVARANIAAAGLADRVQVRQGLALDWLPRLEWEGVGPFDLVFIDADKPGNPDYFAWALKLTRRGSLIVVDNVVREGHVIAAASSDPAVRGVRRMMEMIEAEPRVSATALQTVGSKGYDGFVMALVTSD